MQMIKWYKAQFSVPPRAIFTIVHKICRCAFHRMTALYMIVKWTEVIRACSHCFLWTRSKSFYYFLDGLICPSINSGSLNFAWLLPHSPPGVSRRMGQAPVSYIAFETVSVQYSFTSRSLLSPKQPYLPTNGDPVVDKDFFEHIHILFIGSFFSSAEPSQGFHAVTIKLLVLTFQHYIGSVADGSLLFSFLCSLSDSSRIIFLAESDLIRYSVRE